jgi:4-hydroxy-tetrahydrodipicolinate synthase
MAISACLMPFDSCDGLLSGAGSVIADLQVALWNAIRSDDLRRAREINDRIYPTVQAFYADPLFDMHNRYDGPG